MPGTYVPLTLAAAARRIQAVGLEDAEICIRDFLDDWYAADQSTRETMIRDVPPETGDKKYDAYLAALAEYFASRYGLSVPSWVYSPDRFLDRFWFPTSCKSLHAMALVQSPAAFLQMAVPCRCWTYLVCAYWQRLHAICWR